MKKHIYILFVNLALIAVSSDICAQKWQLNELSFGIGIDNDHYASLSLDDMLVLAEDPSQLERDLTGMTEEASTINTGLAFYLHYGLNPFNKSKGEYRTDRMLQLGVGFHTPKEAMLTYKNEDLDTSIVYCNVQSEITLESSYLFLGRWGQKKRLRWYVGLGASFGYTFNNQMMLIPGKYFGPDEHPSSQENFEQNMTTYDANSVLYTRLFVPYGIHYALGSKSLLGFDFRTGIGMQMIKGEDSNYIKKTGAFVISYKYSFL